MVRRLYGDSSTQINSPSISMLGAHKFIELNLSLATKIGNIVAQLHDANITHGDLTTSNMMATYESNDIINENSKVVLIDFGLAVMKDDAFDSEKNPPH